MIVNLYTIESDDSWQHVGTVNLSDCFPDDPQALALARADIARWGEHRTGGGAAPRYVIRKAHT